MFFEWFGLTPVEISALWLSVQVGLWCVITLLVPGIACGWLLARKQFPGKSLLEAMVHLPMVLPPVVTGCLLLLLLGKNGVLGKWLYEVFGWQLAFTWKGAALASTVMAFPLMVRSVKIAVEMIDRNMEEVSQTLGAGPFRCFLTVTLPLAIPGILTGAALAFARSLGEFGATITFAGNIQAETQTLPLAVFSQLQIPGAENAVLRLTILSIIVSLGAVAVSQLLETWFMHRIHRVRESADA